jgi:hypothetical protein
MYRINLYREFFSKRQQARLKTGRTALLAGLVGLEIVLVGVLVVSAALIREQSASIRAEISHLSTRLGEESASRPGLETARQILDLRENRVVWSPKLACLSDRIDRALVLKEVVGQVSEKRPAEMTVTGQVRSGSAQMEPVARFMEAIRNDPRMRDPFSNVRLGALEGTEGSTFQIVCGSPKPEEAGS